MGTTVDIQVRGERKGREENFGQAMGIREIGSGIVHLKNHSDTTDNNRKTMVNK